MPLRPAPAPPARTLRAPGLDWLLMLAVLALVTLGTLLVWSATSHREDLTLGDPTAYLRKQLVNVAIGLVLLVMVMATDHRWVRILAPLVYLASIVGPGAGADHGLDDQRLAVVAPARRHVDPALGVRQARGRDRHGAGGRRARRGPLAQPGRHRRGGRDAGRSPASRPR